jgi:CheY-like chemotaxis protein
MPIGLALLVSANAATIQLFRRGLREFSVAPDVCRDGPAAIRLLNRRKYDAVIVDLQMGGQCAVILDEVHRSPSNRTAVTFVICGTDEVETAAYRKRAGFAFEHPVSAESIRSTLKFAYGLILRARRRYFRCPFSIPVVIQRRTMPEIRAHSINISEGGMAVSTAMPLGAGEEVQVRFTLPGQEPFLSESTICWWKTDHLGVRFVNPSRKHQSALQVWLAQKLEEMLPQSVAQKFQP